MMKTIHYSWLICAGCTLLLFCTAGLTTSAFSVYQPYLIAEGGLSNVQGSEIITIRSLSAVIAFLFVERFYRKMDIRLGVLIAALGSAGSFILFGIAHDFAGYCIAAASMGVFYGLGGMIPVSILIGRWFKSYRVLALGICAAGTGVATVVAPPVVTLMIERGSLAYSFYLEAGFICIAAVVLFITLRNWPEEKGLTPLFTGKVETEFVRENPETEASRGIVISMFAAVILIGIIANVGFAHVSVLYKSEGFDSMQVAFIVSFVGAALTAGKIIYGTITYRMGAYRSGYLFFGLLIAGEILCCLAGTSSLVISLIAMACLGLGLPLATVGLSVFAADIAKTSEYGKMVKRFQMAYMIGSLVFGPLPGLIADATGSYVPFYVLLSVLAMIAMVLVQFSYKRMKTNHTKGPIISSVFS